MKHLKVLSVLFLLIFVFSACKKDDAATTTTTASKSDLIAKTWQVQKITAKVSGLELPLYEKGKTDNQVDFSKFRFTFTKDGKYSGTDLDGQSQAGNWKFTENETKIVIDAGTADEVTFTLSKLTSSNLDFYMKVTEDNVESTVTYYMIPA